LLKIVPDNFPPPPPPPPPRMDEILAFADQLFGDAPPPPPPPPKSCSPSPPPTDDELEEKRLKALEMRKNRPIPVVFNGSPPKLAWRDSSYVPGKMNHGGERALPPCLLVDSRFAESDALDAAVGKLANGRIIAGRSNGFQIWRWCWVDPARQFVPLTDISLSPLREYECGAQLSNTTSGKVVICKLANFTVVFNSFSFIMPMITVEIDGEFILFTIHPEERSREGLFCGANRYLWIDVPLLCPKEQHEANVLPLPTMGRDRGFPIFDNKDVALLICRLLDQKELGRLAQVSELKRSFESLVLKFCFAKCSKLLKKAVDQARVELIRASVYDYEAMVSHSHPVSKILAAHFTPNFLRVSATYRDDKTIDKIIMELQLDGVRAVRWCKLPKENQRKIERPMFID